MTKRKKTPRVVHVICPTPVEFSWLSAFARGATRVADGFEVTDESQWAESLRAARGEEIK